MKSEIKIRKQKLKEINAKGALLKIEADSVANKIDKRIERERLEYLKKYEGVKGAKARFYRSDPYKKIQKSNAYKELDNIKRDIRDAEKEAKNIRDEIKKIRDDEKTLTSGVIYEGPLFGVLRGGASNSIYRLISRIGTGKTFSCIWSEVDDNGNEKQETLSKFKDFLIKINRLAKIEFQKNSSEIFDRECAIGYSSGKNTFTLSFALDQ